MSTPIERNQSGIAISTRPSGRPDENDRRTTEAVRQERSASISPLRPPPSVPVPTARSLSRVFPAAREPGSSGPAPLFPRAPSLVSRWDRANDRSHDGGPMDTVTEPMISSDSHIVEPPDLWEKWLEPEFRPYAPK